MPLYEYKCDKCGEVFEVLQQFSDAPLEVHTGCGGTVERLISPPAFQFKGSGWYITDYAKSNGKSPGNGKSAKTERAATESKSEAAAKPAESKPPASSTESSKS